MWLLLVLTLVAVVLVAALVGLIVLAARSSMPRAAAPVAAGRAPRVAPSREASGKHAANSLRQAQLARDAEARPRVDLTGAGFDFDIVGESFYEENLRRLDDGRLREGVTVAFDALVVPDPANPFSKSGMAVMVAAEGFGPIGHFAEDDSRRYRAVSGMLLARGAVGRCEAWLIGGRADAPNIGARLSIRSPAEILGTPVEAPRPRREEANAKPAPVYAGTVCPYCGVDLVPPPKRKKKCPDCAKPILVRRAFDQRYCLLRESDLAAFEEEAERHRAEALRLEEAEEEAERATRVEADRARGVLIGEALLDVVGESRFKSALGRIVGAVAEPDEWVSRECVARLVYDGENSRGPLVRVEIDGEQVGFLGDEDAQEYEEFLLGLEREGRPALVRATIQGKAGIYGVTLNDVPDPEP